MNQRGWVLAAVLLGVVGCAQVQTRGQSEDESERDREAGAKIIKSVEVVHDVAGVAGAESIAISGVGLVVGLDGTGGSAPPGGFRAMLEDELHKRGVTNVKELLADPSNSLVLVSALIPAGARKGDPIDVDVTLPPQSKTTSLRGGRLVECVLRDYDSTRNVSPKYHGGDRLLRGKVLAKAEGAILVGFGDGEESGKLKRGRIWGGGRCLIDRPFFVALNEKKQFARVAMKVADRINETFQGSFRGMAGDGYAKAENKEVVYLGVPPQYKHNLPRYLRVVGLIPLAGAPPAGSPYRHRLDEDLLDPTRTVMAALRLEALGSESIPALKRGLLSEHPLVRFTSAEALAYLGCPACGDELAKLVEQQPVLRAYCLTALASLDEAVCHVKLNELLASTSAETRYGAFHALRVLDEHEPAVRGELLNDSFWLHRAAPQSPGLVHISSSQRPEVVLFGERAFLEPPFSFLAGTDFTVTASAEDGRCTITRISLQRSTQRRQCSLALEDVLQTLTELGGTYPDAVELLRQADRCKCLTCPVAVDALPEATSVYRLAKLGAGEDAEALQTDEEIVKARADLSPTPTLFDNGARRRPRIGTARNDAAVRPENDDPWAAAAAKVN
jgi:hypothetical protein